MAKTLLNAGNLQNSAALFRPNRPVVVSTLDRDGTPHLAPFAWCKPVSSSPPLVTLALLSDPRKQHSLINIEREKQFVINFPGYEFAAQLVRSSYRYPIGVRKAGIVGCNFGPSQALRTPVVEQCQAHVECKLINSLVTGDHTLLVGEVVAGAYLEDRYHDGFILNVEQYPSCLHLGNRTYPDRQIQVFIDKQNYMAVNIPYDLGSDHGGCPEQQVFESYDQMSFGKPPVSSGLAVAPVATYAKSLSCPTGVVITEDQQSLFFADWAEGVVYQCRMGEKPRPYYDTQGMPCDVCSGPDGSLYIADMGRKAIFHVPPEEKGYPVIESRFDQPLCGPLACAVDGLGNIYFTDADGLRPVSATGRLFRLRPDGVLELLHENLVFPSALALSNRGDTLYLAETFAKQIRRITLGRNGELIKQEIIYQHDEGSGPVDIEVDPDGRLYVPVFGSGKILVLSESGKLLKTIDTPGMLPTSVAVSDQRVYVSDIDCGSVIGVI